METIKVQLIRSTISSSRVHKTYAKSIGLSKLWSTRVLPKNNFTFGILKRIPHLIRIVG